MLRRLDLNLHWHSCSRGRVLLSILTIRLGGSRAALRRRIKLALTAGVEFPIPQSISEGGGDSRARWQLWNLFANAANH
jgi:hypothetical protein